LKAAEANEIVDKLLELLPGAYEEWLDDLESQHNFIQHQLMVKDRTEFDLTRDSVMKTDFISAQVVKVSKARKSSMPTPLTVKIREITDTKATSETETVKKSDEPYEQVYGALSLAWAYETTFRVRGLSFDMDEYEASIRSSERGTYCDILAFGHGYFLVVTYASVHVCEAMEDVVTEFYEEIEHDYL